MDLNSNSILGIKKARVFPVPVFAWARLSNQGVQLRILAPTRTYDSHIDSREDDRERRSLHLGTELVNRSQGSDTSRGGLADLTPREEIGEADVRESTRALGSGLGRGGGARGDGGSVECGRRCRRGGGGGLELRLLGRGSPALGRGCSRG